MRLRTDDRLQPGHRRRRLRTTVLIVSRLVAVGLAWGTAIGSVLMAQSPTAAASSGPTTGVAHGARAQDVVTKYADSTISRPEGITAGPDGALWFTNYG